LYSPSLVTKIITFIIAQDGDVRKKAMHKAIVCSIRVCDKNYF